MARRVHRKTPVGAVGYFRQQLDAVARHGPRALRTGDPHAIHQTRVATRRLKTLCDVVKPIIDERAALKELAGLGKLLRRRLGALRDLDVQRDLLAGERSAGARWLCKALERERADRLAKARRKLDAKLIARDLSRARQFAKAMKSAEPALRVAVWEAGHLRLDEFTALASRREVDLHLLRIAGKALRYALEIAHADGAAIDAKLIELFKSMQDDLGHWHDRVVLAIRAAEAIADDGLPAHRPGIARDLARLIDRQLTLAQHDVERFRKHWSARAPAIERSIRDAMPLSRDVSRSRPGQRTVNSRG